MAKLFEYDFWYDNDTYNKILRDNVLTNKEKKCLSYLVKGMTGNEIASEMNCTPRTIYTMRRNIYRKLNNMPIENMWVIYILIFPNEKCYIGRALSVESRWNNGKGYKENEEMYADIQKYGWENIEKKILYRNLTPTEAKRKENETIVIYKSYMPEYGYNKLITE